MSKLFRHCVWGVTTTVTLMLSFSVHAFDVNGPGWAAGQATFHTSALSTTGSGLSSAQLQTAFIGALDEWSSASNFNYLTTSGSANPCASPSSNPSNNSNGYTFASTHCQSAFGSTTLAIAITWRSSAAGNIIQSGIVFNSAASWGIYNGTQGSGVDFRRVAVHELGHSLGLAHSEVSLSIMLPFIGATEVPQSDDFNGVDCLYNSATLGQITLCAFSYLPAIIMLLLDDE